ncbi:MAG: hypothetical protein AAF385_10375, partial [Pseudomonadota bacterium]
LEQLAVLEQKQALLQSMIESLPESMPTFPQLYVNEELIGGSDIVIEMYQSGELQSLLGSAD